MRAALRVSSLIGLLGLGVAIGDVGCTSSPKPVEAHSTRGVALVFPASKQMAAYGIVDWRLYLGRTQFVVTGYSEAGQALRGFQLAAFSQSGNTPAHYRLTILDGSGATFRRYANGKHTDTGPLTTEQNLVLYRSLLDIYQGASTADLAINATHAPGSIRPDESRLGTVTGGLHLEDGASAAGCAYYVPLTVAGGVFTTVLGIATGATCGTAFLAQPGWLVPGPGWIVAGGTAAGCGAAGAGTVGAGVATGTAFTRAVENCSNACQNCLQGLGSGNPVPNPIPGVMSSGNPGIRIESSGVPASGLNILDESSGGTCPLADQDGGTEAGSDDSGSDGGSDAGDDASGTEAGSDDSGSDGGSDAGDDASSDDGGTDDGATGDDGGSGEYGGGGDDENADGGGTDDPQQTAENEQSIDQMADNQTCDSCLSQGDGSDLTVNPSNGDVTIAGSQLAATSESSSPTGDSVDQGTASSSGSGGAMIPTGDDTGSSSGGGQGDDSSSSSSSG
jgi:hypothetical protein